MLTSWLVLQCSCEVLNALNCSQVGGKYSAFWISNLFPPGTKGISPMFISCILCCTTFATVAGWPQDQPSSWSSKMRMRLTVWQPVGWGAFKHLLAGGDKQKCLLCYDGLILSMTGCYIKSLCGDHPFGHWRKEVWHSYPLCRQSPKEIQRQCISHQYYLHWYEKNKQLHTNN